MSVPDFDTDKSSKVPEGCSSPYDFYRLFLSDEFMEELVTNSKLYATRKNRPEIASKINKDSLIVNIAIMHMTGYLTPSNGQMYWEKREDTQNLVVKKAMSKRLFRDLTRNTYFTSQEEADPDDKFWKVRLLFDHLNKTAKLYIRVGEWVSVDEAVIKYFGPHPLKQYMKGKPHRFGYKVKKD